MDFSKIQNGLNTSLTKGSLKELIKSEKVSPFERATIKFVYDFLDFDEINSQIIGSFVLFLNGLYLLETHMRKTKDVDANYEEIDNLSEALATFGKKYGYEIGNFRQTRGGNSKCFICIQPIDSALNPVGEKDKLLLDLSPKRTVSSKMLSARAIIETKLNLQLENPGRRIKDAIDFMINYDAYFPQGLAKYELLEMVKDKTRIEIFLSKESIDMCLEEVSRFKLSYGGTKDPLTLFTWFREMLDGLLSSEIPDNWVFVPPYWKQG